MSEPKTPNSTMKETLRAQAAAIYTSWVGGHVNTASAMLRQVPHDRTAYVVMTMTVLAIHEGKQYPFLQFIEGATK